MKDKKLQEAIQVIEEAGGFVMMDQDESDVSHLVSDDEVKNQMHKKDYEERKQMAFDDFDEAIKKKNCSFTMMEDICFENGVDLDDLEDWLLSQ